MIVTITATSGTYCVLMIHGRRAGLLRSVDAKLLTAAHGAKAMLPPDYHDRIVDEASVSREQFLDTVRRFDALCVELDLSYLWSVMVLDKDKDGKDDVVFTTATSVEKNQDPAVSRHAWFLEAHRDPESFADARTTMKTQHSTFHNEWGEGRMVLVPFKDVHGRTYIFGASVNLGELSTMIRQTILEGLAVGVALMLPVIGLGYVLSRSLSAPIGRLTHVTEQIAEGDLDQRVDVGGTRELTTLSRSFATMQRAIRDRMADLRDSEQRFRDLVESSSDWIWEVDADGVYTYSSPMLTDLLGYTPEEVVGKTPFDLMSPEEADRVSSIFHRAVEACQPIVALENVVHHKDGTPVTIETSCVPVLDAAGALVGFRGVDRDITPRKLAEAEHRAFEAQIQHAQKLESLGVLAGGIAHDFNNLLMAIMGNADLALLDAAPESPIRTSLGEIKKASQRAAELARQMLAYSGRGRFVVEPLDLTETVREMTHMLEVSVSKKAVLRYDFSEDLPAIRGDATQIRQVIMNLITNASDAIGKNDGVISVATGAMQAGREDLQEAYFDNDLPEGTYVMLEVADTGCGMDTETLTKLFDPFFTTKFTGRGLGLAAVLGIVRGHKGTIRITSEMNKGTTVRVLLPAIADEAVSPASQARADQLWRGSGTVLLVDDEESVRTIATTMLQRLGMTVVTAVDGQDAVDVYRRRGDEIGCVIMDLTMPRMDGEQAYRELRRIRADVAVIISSGYDEQDVTPRFGTDGPVTFIQKPYELARLAGALRRVFG